MAEEMNKNLPLGETEEEIEEIDVYTLTDENGKYVEIYMDYQIFQ